MLDNPQRFVGILGIIKRWQIAGVWITAEQIPKLHASGFASTIEQSAHRICISKLFFFPQRALTEPILNCFLGSRVPSSPTSILKKKRTRKTRVKLPTRFRAKLDWSAPRGGSIAHLQLLLQSSPFRPCDSPCPTLFTTRGGLLRPRLDRFVRSSPNPQSKSPVCLGNTISSPSHYRSSSLLTFPIFLVALLEHDAVARSLAVQMWVSRLKFPLCHVILEFLLYIPSISPSHSTF